MTDINTKLSEYLDINKQLVKLRKKQKEFKVNLKELEEVLMDHMSTEGLDSISTPDGQVVLYEQKKSKTFDKEIMAECIKTNLNCDSGKATKLVTDILGNKVFDTRSKLKAKLKKED